MMGVVKKGKPNVAFGLVAFFALDMIPRVEGRQHRRFLEL